MNLNKLNKIGVWVASAVAVIAVIFGFYWLATRAHAPLASNHIKIVAAENFWGSIASQLGGEYVEVTSVITDPTTDPHLYESDARDSSAIANADLVIVNGLGYDDFMNKLVAASGNKNATVVSAAQILNISGTNANPHVWYDIPRVGEVAATITAQLIAKDVGHQAAYEANLTAFKASLQPLTDTINQIKTKYPGAPVAYTERVSEYLLLAAGLRIQTPAGFASAIEEGNDPSPADQTAFTNLITSRQIKVLLYNSQATSPATERLRALAQQANIPVVGVTETMPEHEPTYQTWQLHQLDALLAALNNNR